MKAISFLLSIAFLCTFAACTPEPISPNISFGDPYEGINGTWKLKTFTQTDLQYKAVTKPSLDLTTFWTKNGNLYTCTFNKSNKTYTTAGDVRVNYLGASGTFKFDDDSNPSAVIMTSTNGQELSIKLNRPIRAEYGYNLDLTQPKIVQGKPSIAYNYVFTK